MKRIIFIIMFIACAGVCSAQFADTLKSGKDTLRSLNLKEVEVLAQRRKGDATTSYLLNRLALDHHQMLNLSGIATLLPGGKTVNPTLTDDSRLGLRSSSLERGNATFGTAIEIDGMRLDNNGMMDETAGASTRGVSSSNNSKGSKPRSLEASKLRNFETSKSRHSQLFFGTRPVLHEHNLSPYELPAQCPVSFLCAGFYGRLFYI